MKTDLRVIKSRAAIENAFINLVEMKGFQAITIKEIADKAMVNRNTIYLNYGSKEDILSAIVYDSVSRNFGDLSKFNENFLLFNKKKIEYFYRKLFDVVNENIELYRILLTDNSSIGYIRNEFRKIQKRAESLIKEEPDSKIKLSFMYNGIVGVLQGYIVYATGTEEQNISFLTDLTYLSLKQMKYIK